jgi:HEAT repeat protein
MEGMRLVALLLAGVLCVAAADTDSKQKIKAIKEFARQGSTGLGSVSGYLRDQDVEVRREAVRAIVSIGTLGSLDPLVGACRDADAEVQQRAIDGMVNFYLPGYVENGLIGSMKRLSASVGSGFSSENGQAIDPDTPVRPEVVEAMTRLLGSAEAMETRAHAARAVGILRARAAVPALVESLHSKDDGVMFEALIALQKIRDTSAGGAAIFLTIDLNEKIQLAAIDTVGMLRTADAVPNLERVVEKGKSKARRAALGALGQIANPTTHPLFVKYLSDKDDGLRASAAEGLGRTGTAEDRAAIERLFQTEKRPAERLSYAFAMVKLGDMDTATDGPMRYLSANLTSHSWRGVASPFLIELARSAQVRPLIYQILKDLGDRDELSALADVLAVSGAKDSLPPLEELARHQDPGVSRQALRAIRLINSRN